MEYENMRRVAYDVEGDSAVFIPVCESCHRIVKADDTIIADGFGNVKTDRPNATCSKCGRTKMIFEGFYP